ncbi:TPR repeat-containing protein [Calothrix brevissima NIES-22]|nr:TPR repeat-containing protein [Calothrix brevissima NIES-22]
MKSKRVKKLTQPHIQLTFSHLRSNLKRYSLIMLLMLVFLSDSVRATSKSTELQIAQQSQTSQDSTRAATQRLITEAMQLFNQGTAASKLQAIEKLEQALKLSQQLDDKLMQAFCLWGLGNVYVSLEQMQKALEYFNQALPLFRAENNQQKEVKLLEAGTLLGIGTVYFLQADAQQALDNLNQALSLFHELGNKDLEANSLQIIGGMYLTLGEKQKALDEFNQALSLFRGLGDRAKEASTLSLIANVYRNSGILNNSLTDKQKSLQYYNQVLQLFRNLGNREEQANTLFSIAYIYDDLEQKQKARDYYKQSLPLFLQTLSQYQVAGDKLQQSNTLYALGNVYNALEQKQKALEYYNQALFLNRALGNKVGEGFTLYWMARVEYEQGNFQKALTLIQPVIDLIEDVRSKKINNQEYRTSFFATVQNSYKLYIYILMQLHKQDPAKKYDALALHISERSRARSLLELLTEARVNLRQGVDAQLLAEERSLQQQIDGKKKIRIELLSEKNTSSQIEKLNQEIAKLLDKYSQVQADIRAKSPRYATITQPQPLTLEQIQSAVLDDNTILLQYFLGKEHSYLWLVTKTGMKSYELSNSKDIEVLAKQFYQNIANEKLDSRGGIIAQPVTNAVNKVKVAQKLSQILLQPVAGELGNKRLLIVGDGILQYIPFAALPIPSNRGNQGGVSPPLLTQHEIVTLPSASTIAVVRNEIKNRQPAIKQLAILADPVFSKDDSRVRSAGNIRSASTAERTNSNDVNALAVKRSFSDVNLTFNRLNGTRTEAEQILSLVPEASRKSAFGFDANRNTATSPEMSQYQIIHFATHGIFNSKNPEFSGVVLSLVDAKGNTQNGFLQLQDIFNLNLPAELVVLSACQTGLGEEIRGEGLVGLTRGFMYAGSPRVAVSLWSVGDRATAELMTKFYTKMLKDKLKPAAALRAAQLEMWQNPQYSDPYFWAAFTLQGEWR